MEEQRGRLVQRNHFLRQHRMQRHWRQQDVAEQLQISVITVQRWERGNQQPSTYYRNKLCELFSSSAQELGLMQEIPLSTIASSMASEPERIDIVSTMDIIPWTIPYPRNIHFTGREGLLHYLEQQFSPSDTNTYGAALRRSQALIGLGGIGKTQIALEYAYRAYEQERYTYIFWINASSEETILTGFGALTNFLPALHARRETDPDKLIAAIVYWLEQCTQPWLLIFDNVNDLSLAQSYLPQRGNGNILLTTRIHAVGSVASSVEVENMDLIEGRQLLLRRAQREIAASSEEINEATGIVVALAQFPLAIDQAGAYIEETGCSLSNYLQLYCKYRSTLLARRGIQSIGYPESVATTWLLSFQRIKQTNPAAAKLLSLCAFLSPDHIPEELLIQCASHCPPPLCQAVADPIIFDQQLGTLLAFSLVKRQTTERLLSLHRLVQVILRDQMMPEEQLQLAKQVVRATQEIFPQHSKEVATWPQCLRYLEQAEMCEELIEQYNLLLPEAAKVLERAGIYLRERASYHTAERLLRRALDLRERLLRVQDIAITLQNLADVNCKQGKYVEAKPLYQRALAIVDTQLGPLHPEVVSIITGLAGLYFEQGKYIEAEPLYRRALTILGTQTRAQQPKVASALNRLASLYFEQGKYTEAEPLYQRALTILEPQHPEVASALNGLANLYVEQHKYTEAELLYQQTLTIREQQLGLNHPSVAYTFNCLASLYLEQGKYAEAEPLYLQALTIRECQLGLNHPYVAYALHGLANLYVEQGKHAEAEPLYQRALTIREQTFPPSIK